MKEKIIAKKNLIHIGIIIIGTVLLLIPAFHSNIWFDESYSVALMNHSFSEIWTIGAHDVHPILYYWILKIVSMIFGTNIMVYRLFSVLGIVVLGIIGYIHVKKDFGLKVGMLFSFFAMFLPVMLNYALEIRMYSWTITTVTLMAIYGFRFLKQKNLKNAILFGLFSIISCYMHYFALICAGIVNLGLIIYTIIKRKYYKKDILIKFYIIEAIQVLLYLPGLFVFISQATRVGHGFWITIQFPRILIDIVNFQFKGNLKENIATIVGIAVIIYVLYIIVKGLRKKENIMPGLVSLIIYILVILLAGIASIISPILYARYLFPITGLLIFSISYFVAKENNKYIIGLIGIVILIMSIMNLISVTDENYDNSNIVPIAYLNENVQPDDVVVYTDIVDGGVVATLLKNNNQYFLNIENWSVEEAYKAYAPQMKVAYDFDELARNAKGKIIIVDPSDNKLYNILKKDEQFDSKYKETSFKEYETKYKNYKYNIRILECK